MDTSFATCLLADFVLLVHFAIVVFIIGSLFFIFIGNLLAWQWVNNLWFRRVHLLAIGIVIFESWLGMPCPLTTLESTLRIRTGDLPYSVSFVEYWIQRILFYEAPSWVFTMGYTFFGLLVTATWWYFPPKSLSNFKTTSKQTLT